MKSSLCCPKFCYLEEKNLQHCELHSKHLIEIIMFWLSSLTAIIRQEIGYQHISSTSCERDVLISTLLMILLLPDDSLWVTLLSPVSETKLTTIKIIELQLFIHSFDLFLNYFKLFYFQILFDLFKYWKDTGHILDSIIVRKYP